MTSSSVTSAGSTVMASESSAGSVISGRTSTSAVKTSWPSPAFAGISVTSTSGWPRGRRFSSLAAWR
ncbi:Uncharacterised protein [Mycobacteroides abscessus]|nr:Uncharacterised protein [Mycobacteroides abscessus]